MTQKKQNYEKYNTLIISGGSTSGLMILGKLEQMILNKTVDINSLECFGGTSVGALISFLLILDFSPTEIIVKLIRSKILDILNKYNPIMFLSGMGMLNLENIETELRQWLFEKKNVKTILFKDLDKKFVCAAFNFTDKNLEYFSTIKNPNVDVIKCVLMSCAIPLLFNPYQFDNKIYIDGGILDNFPISKTIELFEATLSKRINVLALEVVKDYSIDEKKLHWNIKDILPLLFSASIYFNKRQQESNETNRKDINIDIIKLESNLAFYNLKIEKEQICKLFIQGYLHKSENSKIEPNSKQP